MAPLAVRVPEGEHGVEAEDQRDHHGGVPEVAVHVVQDQRQPRLPAVRRVRLGDRAGRRAQPERPVVGLAVVVAGQPEAQREDQDDQRRRQRPPRERLAEVGGALDAVAQAGRVERREVGRGVVVRALERPDGGVDDERRRTPRRWSAGRATSGRLRRVLLLDAGPSAALVTPASVDAIATSAAWISLSHVVLTGHTLAATHDGMRKGRACRRTRMRPRERSPTRRPPPCERGHRELSHIPGCTGPSGRDTVPAVATADDSLVKDSRSTRSTIALKLT